MLRTAERGVLTGPRQAARRRDDGGGLRAVRRAPQARQTRSRRRVSPRLRRDRGADGFVVNGFGAVGHDGNAEIEAGVDADGVVVAAAGAEVFDVAGVVATDRCGAEPAEAEVER